MWSPTSRVCTIEPEGICEFWKTKVRAKSTKIATSHSVSKFSRHAPLGCGSGGTGCAAAAGAGLRVKGHMGGFSAEHVLGDEDEVGRPLRHAPHQIRIPVGTIRNINPEVV